MHCEEEKCTVVLVVLQLKKKNAVVYIDRIQYLLELVPDPKKGEVRLPPTLNGAAGSTSNKKMYECCLHQVRINQINYSLKLGWDKK